MSTQPNRPGQIEEIDEDLKRVLDERVAAAKKDSVRVSREDLLRNGLQNSSATCRVESHTHKSR